MQWNLILVHVLSSWLYESLHISSLKSGTMSFVLCYNQARDRPGEVGVGSETLRLQLTLPTRSRTISVQNLAKAAGCDCLHLTDCSPLIPFLFKEGEISTMTLLLNACIFLWSLEFPGYNLRHSRRGVPTVDTAEKSSRCNSSWCLLTLPYF